MTWKEALETKRGRWSVVFISATFLMMLLFMPAYYRDIITPKPGIPLNDAFLNLFTPRDVSIPIFVILYLAVGHTLIAYRKTPQVFLLGIVLYCAVNILRTATMYILTLEPPVGMILLRDPISSALYPENGFAKDLFFSGHVSTIMGVVLVEVNHLAKRLKIAGTVILGILLAWQHVHYTIDLLAAPIATYLVFLIVRKYFEIRPGNGSGLENTKSN